MTKKRANALIIGLFLVILSGIWWYYGSFAFTVNDLSQMPEIVFMCYTDNFHLGDYKSGYPHNLTFLDRNGNLYFTEDSYVCDLGYEKREAEFAAGNLDGRLRLVGTCDTDELLEKCKLLAKVAANRKYEIICPDVMPNVLAEEIDWCGLYYDRSGKLCCISLHREECMDDLWANDDRATELYEWYKGLFK